MVRDSTNPVRRETSSQSCLTSEEDIPEVVGAGSERLAIVGIATSITVDQFGELGEVHRTVGRREDHPEVRGEALEKEFV